MNIRIESASSNPTEPPSTESDTPRTGVKAVRIFVGLLIVIAIALYVGLYWYPFPGISTPATETKAVSNVKQLLFACRSYADDHAGAFPPYLGVLYPDYMDSPEIFFAEDAEGGDIPTLYYSGFTITSDPDTILIEHPVRYGGNRIIGTVGGRVLREPVD